MTDESKNKWESLNQAQSGEEVHENDALDSESPGNNDEEGLLEKDYTVTEEKITALEEKVNENWNKAVQAMAELDNVRKRAERDVANAHKYGVEKLLKELVPIIDSLEQALSSQVDNIEENEAVNAMKQGIQLTLQLFSDVMAKFGVHQIDPLGKPFDPNHHEAMSMQDAPDAPPGSVIAVFQKGFLLNERVIRPARVIVAKGSVKKVDEEV